LKHRPYSYIGNLVILFVHLLITVTCFDRVLYVPPLS
jgi:hypothetical protein